MNTAGQRGIALVGVLWVGLVLTVIAGSLLYTVRLQTHSARNASDTAAAEAVAEAGISYAIGVLYENARDRTWHADGTGQSYDVPGGTVVVSIQDEGGKIDLNRASEPLLQSLFEANGMAAGDAAEIAGAIADWRDRDDKRRLNGAEERDYRRAGHKWGPKNAAFERVDELRRVLGVSAAVYAQVAQAVTAHSGRRGVDPAVAPKVVLRALPGLDDDKLDEIDRTAEGTERVRLLRDAVTDRRSLANSARRIFSVRAEARTAAGAVYVREAIVRLNTGASDLDTGNQPYIVLDWKRGRQAPEQDRDAEKES